MSIRSVGIAVGILLLAFTYQQLYTTSPMSSLRRVCYLTDWEGNWNYVRNLAKHSSNCIKLNGPETLASVPQEKDTRRLDFANDDTMLIFGGDGGDKGPATLKCYEELVQLKKRYPDRVVLLVGNRDVNKMRLTSELDDSEMPLETMSEEIREGPSWVPSERRYTLLQFLKDKTAQGKDIDTTNMNFSELEQSNTKVNRLQWMLRYTMGSAGDFERRRQELASRLDKDQSNISDDTVVQSYVESLQPGGAIHEYLMHGNLAFVTHQSLFVHGGVFAGSKVENDENVDIDHANVSLGKVPRKDGTFDQYEDVNEWVDKLNAWYRDQLNQWLAQPTWSKDHRTRGGDHLMEYVLPKYPATTVLGRHLYSSGMPMQTPPSIAQRLASNGIKRLIVGHTPHGTCPTSIKQQSGPAGEGDVKFIETIMCDTSYSDMNAPDNRGIAASNVYLEDDRVYVQGELNDGRPIAYATDDAYIGRPLKDGMHVKAKLADADDEYLVFSVRDGYTYSYAYKSLQDILSIGFADELDD